MINTTSEIARNRALFLDSILRSLNKAAVRDAVEVTLNCKSRTSRHFKP